MANETDLLNISVTDIVRQLLPPETFSTISFLLSLTKIIGIIFLVYILFLIIQSFIKVRQAMRLKSIDRNLAEINKKMDLLVSKKKKSPE